MNKRRGNDRRACIVTPAAQTEMQLFIRDRCLQRLGNFAFGGAALKIELFKPQGSEFEVVTLQSVLSLKTVTNTAK